MLRIIKGYLQLACSARWGYIGLSMGLSRIMVIKSLNMKLHKAYLRNT